MLRKREMPTLRWQENATTLLIEQPVGTPAQAWHYLCNNLNQLGGAALTTLSFYAVPLLLLHRNNLPL